MTSVGAQPVDGTSEQELELIDAYWRAANYLSVGQIYLMDNPMLREPLLPEHVKPRLLGHWGTTPGLNLLYAHMNRVIRARDLRVLYVTAASPATSHPRLRGRSTRVGNSGTPWCTRTAPCSTTRT